MVREATVDHGLEAQVTRPTEQPLTQDQRNRILAAVYRDLFVWCPPKEGELRTPGGAAVIETHLDELVNIVRRSTASSIEPYLAQILDDICPNCPHITVSGYCPQRADRPCVLFQHAGPIVRAIGRHLMELGDTAYLRQRTGE